MTQPKRGTKPAIMKSANRKLVLDLIRLYPYSRAEIADMTRLSRASVTIIVDELISNGLVSETEGASSTAGRRPIQLSIVNSARYILSVCIMRGSILTGLVDLGGNVVCERAFSGDLAPVRAVSVISEQLKIWRERYCFGGEKLIGTGVMSPGPLLYLEGRLLNPFGMPEWHDAPITDMLSQALCLPAILERDTNALALEEKYFGRARGVENFMAMQVDVGVGSGIIVHNRLYRGARGLGNEIGHISIDYNGPVCECGGRGCLEKYISMSSLLAGTRFSSWRALTDAAEDEADSEAIEIRARLSRYISVALIGAFNLFDLERVYLMGELSYRSEKLMRMLNDETRPRIIMRRRADEQLIEASDIAYSVRTGAMPMLHSFYHERR